VEITKLRVRLIFEEDLLGSWPADEAVLTRFVSSKAPSPWLQAEEGDTVPEYTQDRGFTVFPQDETGLFLWNYQFKGFLKEAGNALKGQLNVKNLRAKIDNYVFVQPRRLYLLREDGSNIREPDGVLERPLRGQTAKGPRVSLVGSEVVKAPATLNATIEVLQGEITPETIKAILDYGRLKGLGQWRNGGFGVFRWKELQAS